MPLHAAASPRWATASIADAADTAPLELSTLGDHVDRCNGSRGRWFRLQCGVEAVHAFMVPRFMTTLCIAAAVLGIAAAIAL